MSFTLGIPDNTKTETAMLFGLLDLNVCHEYSTFSTYNNYVE